MQRATAKLRALVKDGKFLELPAIHDTLTAKLAESIGFKTIYNGGFVTCGCTPSADRSAAQALRLGAEGAWFSRCRCASGNVPLPSCGLA